MKQKNELVLMNGKGAMTVEGMERIYKALTGKDFTPDERVLAQKEIDAHTAKGKVPHRSNQHFGSADRTVD